MFTAIVISSASRNFLLKNFPPVVAKGWETIAHHCTLAMGEPQGAIAEAVGQEIELEIDAVGAIEGRVTAFRVSKGAELSTNKVPHVTLDVNRGAGAKPFESNKITDWKKIKHFKITGRVEIC